MDSISRLHRLAFDGPAEADLVNALRASGDIANSIVAEQDDEIVGHILFSRLMVLTRDADEPGVSLAPMAVHPQWQRKGIGSRLVRHGLDACRQSGDSFALVLGHPQFYARFGFSAALARAIDSPFGGGDAWMGAELVDGALTGMTGRVRFAAPFSAMQ